nr:hypothetical protein [Tanacetum cinerariifolium]
SEKAELSVIATVRKAHLDDKLTKEELIGEECDVPVCENSPICDDRSKILSDSKNDDDILSDDDDYEDIDYIEALFPDPKIVSVEEENVVHQEEEETRSGNTTTHAHDSLPEYDSFCFEIEPDHEKLIIVLKNDISDDSSNDPLLEEANLFLASDNSIPPDAKFYFEINSREEISVVMNTIDKLGCLDLRDEFDDDDYFSFMYLIYSKMFLSFLSAESEDTIFDPGISI